LKSISQGNSPPTQKSDPVLYSNNNLNNDILPKNIEDGELSNIKLGNVTEYEDSEFEVFVHKGILLLTNIN
jgi:hypothetical protein